MYVSAVQLFPPGKTPLQAWAETLAIAAMQFENPMKRRSALGSGSCRESSTTPMSLTSFLRRSSVNCGAVGQPGWKLMIVLASAGLDSTEAA